ncbi:hypothetical protein GCM10022267_08670 [Lentzea roselyniae]|uniref:Uncharacterized protein n=1 Tax=Lentzea roselyniae TaxID=531940 RepID=A0ABP7A4J6_9PSEU
MGRGPSNMVDSPPDCALPPRIAQWFGSPLTIAVTKRWLMVGFLLYPAFTPENRPHSRSAMIHGPGPSP